MEAMTRAPFLLLTLALMCENVNAAPQVVGAYVNLPELRGGLDSSGLSGSAAIPKAAHVPKIGLIADRADATQPAVAAPFTLASDMPPFKIGDPICNTGFTISQRLDTRDAAGTIIKSVWVRKCTKGRIVYGRKV